MSSFAAMTSNVTMVVERESFTGRWESLDSNAIEILEFLSSSQYLRIRALGIKDVLTGR